MNDRLPPGLVASMDQALAGMNERLDTQLAEARRMRDRMGEPMAGIALLDLLELDHWHLAEVAAMAIVRLVEAEVPNAEG